MLRFIFQNMYQLLALAFIALSTVGAYPPDQITSLPGLPFFNSLGYEQYSGYLEGSPDGRVQLHYWFVTSQSKTAATDPVVLWLNGGPGCSSLDGFLYEHGPLLVSDDGQSLARNPWAWNNAANVIYLESPACVGFSYVVDGNCSVNDDGASLQNFHALVSFFEKFPQYLSNELYITGESYAGVYVPTLSLRVYQNRATTGMNLKGFAVGNGLLSNTNITNTLVTFSYGHGIIGQENYQDILRSCCSVETPFCNFDSGAIKSDVCKGFLFEGLSNVQDLSLNIYDVTGKCEYALNYTSGDYAKERLTRNLIRDSLPEHLRSASAPGEDGETIVPCISARGATIWLNNAETRNALNIPDFVGNWEICNEELPYTKEYKNMHSQFETLLAGGVRALIFNGDVDGACNVLGGSYFINSLGYEATTEYKPWMIGRQIAGWGRSYGDSLQFLTVKGAGHMVPQFKPRAGLELFVRFLLNNYEE